MASREGEYQAVRDMRVMAIVLALLVVAFAAGASWFSLRDERAQQARAMRALAEIGAQSMDGYFMGLQGAMQLAAGEILGPEDTADPARAEEVLRRLKAAFPELRIANLIDFDGTLVASTEPGLRGVRLTAPAQQRSFFEVRDHRLRTGFRGLSIGRAFVGPLSKDWVIPVGFGMWDGKGRLGHILVAGLPVEKPQAVWKDAPLPPGAALGLRSDDGYLLVRYPHSPDGSVPLETVYGKPAMGPLGTYVERNSFPASGQVTGTSRVTGGDNLFVFQRLAHFPLTFFVANPTSNILSAWWERVWAAYVLLLVLMLAGSYVYRWALRRQAAWEQERARQIRMLESANQELEDFAYTIAHDLKAPVRAIDGHAGIALAGGDPLPEAVRHRLGQIRRSASRMGELIDDLLEFSRYAHATVAKRPIDMEALARKVIADVVPGDAGIELVVGPLPPCEADPGLMRVVWTALVSNALKYSANAKPPVIEIGHADGEYFVRDNGVGFDMAHSKKLFSVFSRLHGADEFEGTGAGLAIAHRILQRHGGTIRGEGEPGRGATFRFTAGPSGPAGDSAQE